MTGCAEMRVLMHGLLDGELDAANALKCEQHLSECPNCAAEYGSFEALKTTLQTGDASRRAPEALRLRVVGALDAASGPSLAGANARGAPVRTSPWHRWTLAGSALALAASLILFIAAPLRGPDLSNELVAGHVRSLLAGHLTDVRTSDQHVVKPWFAGKLDFSPPVVDLARAGFPLIGGRLDYLSGHVVAALVFQHREHVINVFISPTSSRRAQAFRPEDAFRDGYHILYWAEAGMDFWAVSDLNLAELREFRREFQVEARS